jgi:predicted dehydrogenase
MIASGIFLSVFPLYILRRNDRKGFMMKEAIRWGILGTGNIATSFATGVATMPDAELAAVGSRNMATADRYGDRFEIERRYASYEEVAQDPDVDVVYIATPHSLHLENMLMCFEAGKPVLCEKPFTINAREARKAVEEAQKRKLFAMEATWMRFTPLMVELRKLLAEEVIGEVRMLNADFGIRVDFDPKFRLFNPELGGGGLLDVGIYPLSLAQMVLGTPNQIIGLAELGQTGVDEQSAAVLGYAGGQLAGLQSAIRTETPQEATIMGTEGWIRIHSPWWMPEAMTIYKHDLAPQLIEVPFTANGYTYEATEVHRCLREGELESPLMPLDETIAIMATMDALRAEWGLRYPME